MEVRSGAAGAIKTIVCVRIQRTGQGELLTVSHACTCPIERFIVAQRVTVERFQTP